MAHQGIHQCHLCGGKVELVENRVMYGINLGWPWIWLCQTSVCRAYVGCHANTYQPLGTLADRQTRAARKAAYAALHAYCDKSGMPYADAKGWVAIQLQLPESRSGIGWLSIAQCQRLITLCERQDTDDFRRKGLAQIAQLREKFFAAGAKHAIHRGVVQ